VGGVGPKKETILRPQEKKGTLLQGGVVASKKITPFLAKGKQKRGGIAKKKKSPNRGKKCWSIWEKAAEKIPSAVFNRGNSQGKKGRALGGVEAGAGAHVQGKTI